MVRGRAPAGGSGAPARAAGVLIALAALHCRTPRSTDATTDRKARPDGALPGEGGGPALPTDLAEALVADDVPALSEIVQITEVQAALGLGEPASGEIWLSQRTVGVDGVEVEGCSTRVSLNAADFAGDCAGCDFAFAVEATVTEDLGGCYWPATHTLIPYGGSAALPPVVAWWSTYTTPAYSYTDLYGTTWTWGGYTYTDLLRIGWTYSWPAYDGPYGYSPPRTAGPYWRSLTSTYYGTWTVERSESALEWSLDQRYGLPVETPRDEACPEPLPEVSAVTGWIGAGAQEGALPCTTSWSGELVGAGAMDRWAFTATAGQEVVVTVDTLSPDTTFDPALWIDGPAGCALAWGDDELECTAPPPSFGCPAIRFTAPEDGVYEVVVTGAASCAGPVGAYVIDVVEP